MPDGKQILLLNDQVLTLWDARHVLADLRVVHAAGGLELVWDAGTLQYCKTVGGEWMDLPFSSPVAMFTLGNHGFFRVRIE
jgi:hypothetical protein